MEETGPTEEATGPTGEPYIGSSGQLIYPTLEEATGPTGPTEEATGPTGATGPTEEATGPTEEVVNTYTEAEQLAMTPAPVVEPNPYIITLEELKATQEALFHKEAIDRSTLFQFVEPDPEELKRKLLHWAAAGLPDGFQITSISVEPPQKCMDGQVRTKFEYVEYLLRTTLYEKVLLLQAKLPGMILSYSLPDSQVCMHVSKA
jgi:hypothetical protein